MQVHSDWLLTPERAAVHVPTATAVIADLHLGYDDVRRCHGEAIPASSLEATTALLDALIRRVGARRLVIAGDLVESKAGTQAAAPLLPWLSRAGVELMGIVPGNHDCGTRWKEGAFPIVRSGFAVGGWQVVHGEKRWPSGRVVAGHFHPCLRWDRWVKAPCFLVSPRAIVLPAFSADAAGVNMLDAWRWRNFRCCVVAGSKVLDLGTLTSLSRLKKNGRTS